MRDVEEATRLVVEQVETEAPDVAGRFETLFAAQGEWCERGRHQGLAIDPEVSITVASTCLDRAQGAGEPGSESDDVEISLSIFGARETETARSATKLRGLRRWERLSGLTGVLG